MSTKMSHGFKLFGTRLIVASLSAVTGCYAPGHHAKASQPFVCVDDLRYSGWGFVRHLRVFADGSMFLEGVADSSVESRAVPRPLRRVAVVDEAHLERLRSLLQERVVMDLDSSYVRRNMDDLGVVDLRVVFPDTSLLVRDYGRAGPNELLLIADALDDLARSATWSPFDGNDADWLARSGWCFDDWSRGIAAVDH